MGEAASGFIDCQGGEILIEFSNLKAQNSHDYGERGLLIAKGVRL